MSRIIRQRRGVKRLLQHAQGLVKIAWYGEVRFKQRAVTEIFVAEKESVTLKRLNSA
jgi:hypothetical protein